MESPSFMFDNLSRHCVSGMQNVDTDQIIPAEYLTLVPSKVSVSSIRLIMFTHLLCSYGDVSIQCYFIFMSGPAMQPCVMVDEQTHAGFNSMVGP